jgi:hypothetical protein
MADEATRAVWRKAAQTRRDKARTERAKAKLAQEGGSVFDFWALNRGTANQDHIAELQAREEVILGILDDMRVVMEDCAPDDEFAADVEDEVSAYVGELGTVAIEVALLEFWRNPNIFARLMAKTNEPTRQFLRYGVLSALPSFKVHQWQMWLASRKPAAPQPVSGHAWLKCVNYETCHDLGTSASQAIVDAHAKLGQPYKCWKCRAWEAPARAAVMYHSVDTIFDSFGRVKDG